MANGYDLKPKRVVLETLGNPPNVTLRRMKVDKFAYDTHYGIYEIDIGGAKVVVKTDIEWDERGRF
jgi:hypothetical protein